MSNDQVTKIAADGLRYTAKEAGSPYQDFSCGTTISCYKCGLHKPRSSGIFKRLLGQNMFKCSDCAARAACWDTESGLCDFFKIYEKTRELWNPLLLSNSKL